MILIRPWGKGKEKGWPPLFTGELGRNLTRERAWREWRRSLEGCPRSRLAFFLLQSQEVDHEGGRAWARGETHWVCGEKGLVSLSQTFYFVREKGVWKISGIE